MIDISEVGKADHGGCAGDTNILAEAANIIGFSSSKKILRQGKEMGKIVRLPSFDQKSFLEKVCTSANGKVVTYEKTLLNYSLFHLLCTTISLDTPNFYPHLDMVLRLWLESFSQLQKTTAGYFTSITCHGIFLLHIG